MFKGKKVNVQFQIECWKGDGQIMGNEANGMGFPEIEMALISSTRS